MLRYNNKRSSQHETFPYRSEEDLNEEEILAAVSGTAEQGLAFLGNLFQITFGESNANANATAESEGSAGASAQRSLSSSKVAANANALVT